MPNRQLSGSEMRLDAMQIAVQALQHVIVLFSGIILVPVILINFYRIPDAEGYRFIFMTGLVSAAATLMQVIRYRQFGLGAPMFMGTSGAFIACAHAAITQGGLHLLSNLVLMTAPLYFLFGFCLRYIRHIITPTVGGVVIMLAMAGLLKDATHVWTGDMTVDGHEAFIRILIGVLTIAVMILAEWIGGRRYRPWTLALGMLAGCITAWFFGETDLSRVSTAPWLGLPETLLAEFVFKPTPAYWMDFFTFSIAVMVTAIKYTGDVMALDQVRFPGRRVLDYDALKGGLFASGLSAGLAGLAGGMPATSHSPNTSLMGMTGIASRRITLACTLLLTIIILSPKTTMLLMSIPEPVAGAVGVVLVSHLFATGMRLVAGKELNFRNGFIAGLSLCVGLLIGSGYFFPNAFPEYLAPVVTNGFAVGGMLAVALTLLTRLQMGRGVAFKVPPRVDHLGVVNRQVAEFAEAFDLPRATASRLDLACEEVFVHMVGESEKNSITREILFRLRRTKRKVFVDACCGTRIDDVSLDPDNAGLPGDLEAIKESDFKSIGLKLLGHIAQNIEHIHINNFAFVSFELSRPKKEA
ncbi:MAG TPA: hypothetical protein DHV36_02265 [Desulfobacteraceae bacterium]|nr:hypothetical protein [Desulfobacteraceae bacterium]